ncbi:hypothetical protein CGRA01v4_03788 [Colletotrichum graminicola]|nr:hypothetical protein CGRA01v4_03788 [Colletotrichum graminicola]
MPTPLDNAMKSRSAVLGEYTNRMITREFGAHRATAFGGLVTAAAVWAIYGGDMFPAAPDPTGNPENWTREEMRRWLAAVCAQSQQFVLLFAYNFHRGISFPMTTTSERSS